MNAALAELLQISQQGLFAGFLTFLRVGAAMALLPAFGEQSVPVRVRLALALAFTFVVAPAVLPTVADAAGTGPVPPQIFATEVIAGLALGMILRLLVLVLVMAGQIAAQATSLAQAFGGAGVDPQPAMSAMLVTAGLALAVMTGLHLRVAEALILSYRVLPPGRLPEAGVLTDWGVASIARGFGLAVTLAMPFVIAALIYNLALGVINRAMPQLAVAFIGAPAITAGGLILLFLAAPGLLELWSGWMTAVLADPFGAAP